MAAFAHAPACQQLGRSMGWSHSRWTRLAQGAAVSTAVWWSWHMGTDLHSLPRRVRRALPGRSTGVQTGAQHMLYHGCNLLVFVPTIKEHGGSSMGGKRLSWGCRGKQLWWRAKDGVLRLHMVVEDHLWHPMTSYTLYSKKPRTTCIVLIFWRQVGEDESMMSVAEEWGASKMCRKHKWHVQGRGCLLKTPTNLCPNFQQERLRMTAPGTLLWLMQLQGPVFLKNQYVKVSSQFLDTYCLHQSIYVHVYANEH